MTAYALSLHNIESPGATAFYSDALLGVTYAINANDVTELEVKLPASAQLPPVGRTTTCKLWRKPRGAEAFYVEGDSEWVLTKHARRTNKDGAETTLTFAHPNVLLQRRLIAYKQETNYADKTFKNANLAQAHIMLLAYIDENFGHLCEDPTRVVSGVERLVVNGPVSADLLEFSAPWRNLLSTLQEISGYKEDGVTRYFFDLRLLDGQPIVRIRPDYLGSDLSETVTFGEHFGNLAEIEIVEDYGREVNICYAGGSGSGLEQFVRQVFYTIPSPYTRSEGFESMGDIDVDEVLADHGLRYLARNRAKRLVKAKIQDGGAFIYGRSYHHGDLVSLAVAGQSYKCHVYAVSVNASSGGETVDIYLEADQLL